MAIIPQDSDIQSDKNILCDFAHHDHVDHTVSFGVQCLCGRYPGHLDYYIFVLLFDLFWKVNFKFETRTQTFQLIILFKLKRGFRLVCNFVYNLHSIIGYDVVRFILIYSIFLAGFSQSKFMSMKFKFSAS